MQSDCQELKSRPHRRNASNKEKKQVKVKSIYSSLFNLEGQDAGE